MRGAAVVLGCLLLVPRSVAEPPAGEIRWTTSMKEALGDASASGRPIFVDVWATWCVPCVHMDATTYRDPSVVARLDGPFVALKVDADAQPSFLQRYAVDAFPTALVLDEKGTELLRHAGALTGPQLLAFTDRVASRFEAYRRARDSGDRVGEADVLLQAGNPDRAADLYRRALKGLEGPAAGPALAGLYRAETARGRVKEAARALERLRKEAPAHLPAPDAAD